MLQAQTTDLIYHLGSSGSSINVASVATDASGNIFVCGDFTGTSVEFNPLGTTTPKTAAASGSGFIASYDANGILKKMFTFGASGVNKGLKVYVDPTTKNVYLLATASGSVSFSGGFGNAAYSGSMALVKYDNALTWKTTRLFNNGTGNAGDALTDLSFYGADLYVTGSLFSSNVQFNPGNPGSTVVNSKLLSPSATGISDIIVAKYDTTTLTLANNTFAYSFGGIESDGGNGIDLDNAGNIYLTGYFTGQGVNVDPVGTKSVSTAGGGTSTSSDAFVAKYNSVMACQWAFSIGAVQADIGSAILVDKSTANVYVGGIVKKDGLDIYFNPITTASASYTCIGLNDFFVASYTSAGAYNWHLATGSTGEDALTSLAFDAGNNIVLSGFASGSVNFGSSKTITGLGGKDAFFAVISGTSGLATAAYNLGGASDEQANGVTVGTTGKILVVGSYKGGGDYNLGAVVTLPISGSQDGFISRHVLCTPPSITTQPSSSTKCEGTAASLTVVASGATSYQWKKGTTIISGATTVTYSIPAVAIAQAGSYTVEVTNACQTVTSTSVTLTVNPKPSITSAAISPVCSGSSVGYNITSDITSSYSWTRANISGITPTTGSGLTSSIAETLISSNLSPTSVDYIITPTTGSCLGSPFTLTVTVNRKPAITSAATASVCSGVALNYAIISNVPSAYGWTRANKPGITPTTGSGSASPIVESLTNSTVSPINVDYIITPTTTTGCVGAPFTLTVTVNPSVTPTIAASSSTTAICAGTSITLTATTTNGGAPTYKWKLGSGYISGATNTTYVTTGAANGDVYSVEMTSSLGCASPATVTSLGVTITVNPSVTPTITVTPTATTICSGTSLSFTASSTNAGTPTYKWKLGSGYISGATNSTYNTFGAVNGDVYSVEMISTATCAVPAIVTSLGVTMTVTPSVTPTITATGASTICTGNPITLTATPTNGGTPTYKWKLGSAYISGATNSTYITTGAVNGDSYSVEITSSLACASPATVTSAGVTITVSSSVTPTVTASSSLTTICPGTSITLTAGSTNGGTPTYKWKLGSAYISGATNATYITTGAVNGDSYSVEITSSLACASPSTVTSTGVTITVTPAVTPTVNITSSGSTTICPGTGITFTATPTNGGTTPIYQWKLGGVNIAGATTATYSTTTAVNGDSYTVTMTSNATCVSPATTTSNAIVITVNALLSPSVAITASPTGAICAGTNITFTATPTNGGTTPTYVWKKNTVTISGATNSTYTTTSALNNDSYSVEMTSSSSCASPSLVTSSPIVITVNTTLVPAVTIASTTNSICLADVITFTSTSVNPGSTPSYVWRKNGVAIIPAATGTSYSTTSAVNSDVYSVVMTSNALCASPSSDASNNITVTVNVLPTITGTTAVCESLSITLTGSGTANASSPWMSATPTVATVSNTGVVTGVLAGTSIITYTNTNGCSETVTVTVNSKPIITGTLSVCNGSTTQLTGSGTASTTNAWVSATPAVATVSSIGLVTAVSIGTSVITYKATSGCTNTVTITVNALPTITGTATLCAGSTTQLTGSSTPDATSPWASATTSIATVNSTGLITGVSAGTSVITYKNSNGCVTTQTVTVNPVATPVVSITANNATICAGTSITFTAAPKDGGATHTYKWKLGTAYISGETNATYSTTAATNGQSYSVEMTSNAICASASTATSNAIVVTITTSVTPIVIISANTGSSICTGTTVIFTATPGNGGSAPTYQWKKGGTIISSSTNATYTSSALANGDQISVDIISNSTCASTMNASSTPITMIVNPVLTPTVSITASASTICSGTGVTFTAAYTNGGNTPAFEWFVNTVSQGAPSSTDTFTSSTLSNGNQVVVKMTSSLACVTSAIVSSNTISMTVTTKVTPSVTITSDKNTICAGSTVTYTATPVNGGTASYQWKVDGTNAGAATVSSTFKTSSLIDANVVTAVLTSSVVCVTSSTAMSNGLTIIVASATVIVSNPVDQSVCAFGNDVTFSVGATGDNLTYQWKAGSTNLANNSTYSGVTTKDLSILNVSNADLLGYKVIVTGICGTFTSTVANLTQATSSINISTQPVAQVLEIGNIIHLSVSVTGPTLSYQWKKNGVDLVNDSRISGANTSSLQISNALVSDSDNNYTCLIMSPCATQVSSSATSVSVTTATSTQDALTKGFMIAPNPSAGHFTLSNSYSPFMVEEVEIISMEGIIVARKTINSTTNLNEEIFTQDLPKGMYLLVIKGEGEQALLKIIFDK